MSNVTTGAGRPLDGHPAGQDCTFSGRLGMVIREMRLRKGYNITEASARTNHIVAPSSWSSYERGVAEPRVSKFHAICLALDADPSEVIQMARRVA